MSNANRPDFGAVYRDHRRDVLRMCTAFLHDAMDSEDACQDAFLKSLQSREAFRGTSSPLTWVTSIAMNGCRGRLRRSRLEAAGLGRYFQVLPVEDDSPGPSGMDGWEPWLRPATLDQEALRVLGLRMEQDLGLREIAGRLGISRHAVNRALLRLRSVLRAGVCVPAQAGRSSRILR